MRFFPGDALDCGEALRLVFKNIKGAIAEGLHNFFRRGSPNAFDCARGEVFQKLPGRGGEAALTKLCAELAAEGGVHIPMPHQPQLFPRGQRREDAHHRNQFPFAV